ncbi:MAG: UDP-2,3-diacylglucosamine diphosphatase [Gammaproteobacteria bacterium]|nr:UDP-2,3-diacylglucosamine diphosphatase [Gammaproteobacteria bacterium]
MKPFTLFVSDLHLDASRPAQMQEFVHFLKNEAHQAQALYILGDLFEFWIGDDDPAEGLDEVIDALRERTARGTAVKFLHGNRDFLVGADFARRTGIEILPARQVVDLHGIPTLIEHGDLLCTDDVPYQRYRRRIRHPVTMALLGSLPRSWRLRMGQRLRQISAQAIAGKSPDIMDVNEETVRQVMRSEGVYTMVHGHTHRPAVHRFKVDEMDAVRAVLGDWYGQGSWLVADADGLHPQPAA